MKSIPSIASISAEQRADQSRADAPNTELAALEGWLRALAQGDFTAGEPAGNESDLVRAVAAAMEDLASRLEPLRRIASRLDRAWPDLDEGLLRARSTVSALPAVLAEAIAARNGVTPRLAEVDEVARRLDAVAAQATVAALNVSVEVSRGPEVSGETLAILAEEVRRLADRTAVATRRLTNLTRELREENAGLNARLELAREGLEGWSADHNLARAGADRLGPGLGELRQAVGALRFPDPEEAAPAVARLEELKQRLKEEILRLRGGGSELPAEVGCVLEELRHLLGPSARGSKEVR